MFQNVRRKKGRKLKQNKRPHSIKKLFCLDKTGSDCGF